MRDSRDYSVYPSDLNVLSSFQKAEEYLSRNQFEEDPNSYCSNIRYRLDLSQSRTLEAKDFREFMELLKQFPSSMPIEMHGHFINKKEDKVAFIITIRKSNIKVIIEADDLNLISAFHEKAREFFQASNPLEEHPKPISRYGLKKSAFLAHRFDDIGNDISARLTTFLSRLGFQVLEGSGYEGKDIPDKVMTKIRTQDIFICIVTPGETSWILSEAVTAKALNKYLILICQEGTEFKKGIIGQDYEYLEFPADNIEKIYSQLLYTLPL